MPPSFLRSWLPTNLTPAPRRQDHTSLPYALMPFVIGTASVHRDPPHDRGDHDTPLWSGRDGYRCSADLDSVKQKYLRFGEIFRLTRIPKIGIYLPGLRRARPSADLLRTIDFISVIARSEATKQSISRLGAKWIASLRSQ